MAEKPLLKDQDDDYTIIDSSNATIEDRVTDLSLLSHEKRSPMSTMKEVLSSERASSDIHLLVVGRTGQGKSTLINSLIELGEEIAREGAEADMCTTVSRSYVYSNIIPGVKVRIVDSPGLQDIHTNEQSYIQEMKTQCQEVTLVLYCMKMTDHRLAYDDTVAFQKLHQAFGPGFWKRVVFVLTFANNERCDQKDSRDEDGPEPPFSDREAWKELMRRRFVHRVRLRAADINAFLKGSLHMDDFAPFVPAGSYKANYFNPDPLLLPDRQHWLRELIKLSYSQMKKKHNFTRLNLNDKIHLALIIDNHGEVKVEENGTRKLNNDAENFKSSLESLGFSTLYFNRLSSVSLSTLLEMFLHVDHSQLATLALIILSKGKDRHIYDCNNDVIYTDDIFAYFPDDQSALARVPKIFFFHLSHAKEPNEKLQFKPVPPKNSIILMTSVDEGSSSMILSIVRSNLTHEASIQQCCSQIHDQCNRKHSKVFCVFIDNFSDKFVLPAPYKPFHQRGKKEYLKKHLEVYRSMWYPIRCKTVTTLIENKDSVLSIVRNERIARIAASSASIVLGGGMVVAGLALLPFTFGASIGLSVAGGVVGATASLGGIGAFITSKILSNKRLKTAQEHISLDQQLSLSINDVAVKYNEAVLQCTESSLTGGELAGEVATGGAQGLANIGRVGMGIAIGIEGAAEAGAIALRTGARAVGVVLAGVSLAVTVPLDLGFIVYHSYHIHKSSKDKSGKADSNKVVQWLIQQTEDMLKGTCTTIELKEYPIEGGLAESFDNTDCGYKINVPVTTEEKSSIKVRTIFSGPFVLPEGYTLVSAVYDITLPELSQPVTIELEHCVDMNDQITGSKMCFAIAKIDLEKKMFVFEKIGEGDFPRGETYASVPLSESCLLCILYSGSLQDTSMKYAGQCCYAREYRNYWIMSIVFTKHLSAHLKYVQFESVGTIECHPFLFTRRKADNKLLMELDKFQSQMDIKGWKISPHTPIPVVILKSDIDSVELQQEFWKVQCNLIPSIEFSVYVYDEGMATNELDKYLDIEGTTSNIFIKRQKE